MFVAFPAPVLSVTADAVRELEGGEALSGLWTLFTKCKESLKDGRRLENISWRLWYRELMLAGPPSAKESGDYRPLTPTLDLDEAGSLPPIPSSIRSSGSVERMRVGRVIYDMLPNNADTTTMPAANPTVRFHLSILPLLPLPEPTTTKDALISATESLPTPALEDAAGAESSTSASYVNEISPGQVYAGPPSPEVDVRGELPSSSILMALISQPPLSTISPLPSSTSANPPPTQISIQTPTPRTPPPPTLVVVNPTPNLTPHPTPPATPGLERKAHGQYLTLPGRAGTLPGGGGSARNSGGQMSAGEAGVGARTKADERKDGVLRKEPLGADAQFDERDVDAAEKDNNKLYQHHQKYNSTSSTSSHASSSSVTGTTGVTSASASDVDVDEAKVVCQEGEQAQGGSIGLMSTRDECTSPAPEASCPPPKSTSPKPQSQSRSPTTTTTTTVRSSALHSAPAITRRASSGGAGGGTSRSRSRPALSVSGTSTKSKSRSRSRDAGIGGGALALGMTKKIGGGGKLKLGGGVSRGKLGGNGGKGLSRKGSRVDVGEGEQGEEREALNVRAEREYLAKMEKELENHNQREEREREGKRLALFNIGSHSDNGSKSAGSGSDVSGLVGGVHEPKVPSAYELAQGTREADALKGKGEEDEEMRVHRDKANQKEKDNFKAKLKEREEATVAANLALAAQQLAQLAAPLLPQQLAAPLLPQQQRRTIVLATSESDYETDSDDDEDGSWSSEEMSGDENVHQVEVKHVAPPPPPAPAHRIAPIQKTVSNHTRSTAKPPLSRAQIHRAQAQANTQAIMEKAAAEAQRQRDMFAKLPVASFQNPGPSRTRSAGLLTQLLNPPMEIFPANHPYRRGYSSGEIRAGQQQQQQGQGQQQQRGQGPSHAPRAPGGMQVSKSAAALPISSQVQVGSVYGKGVALAAMPTVNGNGNANGGYRPKGRPQGQELEDDSGSEDEANAGIQVSKSVAQERLKALAQRRGIVTHGKQKSLGGRLATVDDDVVPPWALGPHPPPPPTTAAYGQLRRQVSDRRPYPEEQPPTPTPIPVGHPYNLPPPAAPSTPRTTRRQMLQTEMSESLRRNLLWERQVSKVNLVGHRNGGGRNNVLAGLKPLTTTPSMVQLRAKGEAPAAAGPSNAERTKSNDRERRGSGGGEAEEREERRRLAMARNKSWADDYHFKGW